MWISILFLSHKHHVTSALLSNELKLIVKEFESFVCELSFYLLLFDERPWGKSVLNLISFDVTKKTLLMAKLLTDKSLVTGFSLHIIILSWILLFWQCLNFCVIIGIKGVRCLPVTRKQCLLGSCFIAFTVDRTNRMYDMLCRQIIALCHTYFASFAVCNRRQN